MKRVAVAAVVLLGAAAAGLRAQQSAVTIQGQVSAADGDREPLAHARVLVYDDKTPEALFFAGTDGRFAFTVSTGRRRRMMISKAGFAPAELTLSAAALSVPLDVRLRRGGVISGRVIDVRGEPYSNATINLIQPRPGGDVPTLKTVRTDDLGEYRLWGLAEGTDYVVELAVTQRDMLAVWYPGTDNIDRAERITVRAGDEKTGIDFATETAAPLPTIEGRATMSLANNSLVLSSGGRVANFDNLQRPLTGGAGVIRGRVTLPSGTPLPAATVGLASLTEIRPTRSVPSDDDGRFVFDRLPSGEYFVGAAKAAYVSSNDRDPQSGVQVRLADGEVRTDIDIVLTRPAVITGRVLDEFGEPYEGAVVSLWQTRYEAGRRRLVGVGFSTNPTDDRGRYRLFNVAPGRYLVAASAGPATPAQPVGDVPGYAVTYFPAAAAPDDAQPVDITRATTVADLDIGLMRAPTSRISGRVLRSNRQVGQVGLQQVTLGTSSRSKGISGPPFSAIRDPDGGFQFRNVPPGDYVIQVNSARPTGSLEGDFATQFVTVTGTDVANVLLQVDAGSTIAGHLTFDGRDPPASPDFAIVPESADADLAPRQARSVARAEVNSDLTFEIGGVHGPRRIEITDSREGWTLKSVFANGVDVTDRALPFGQPQQSLSDVEVVLTNRLTELAGSVTDNRGDLTRDYTLLVFPTDRDRWYSGSRFFRRVVANANGSFALRGLPPGDYYVAPVLVADVPRDGETAWQDPEFLDSIAVSATRVTLTEGQKTSASARLISTR